MSPLPPEAASAGAADAGAADAAGGVVLAGGRGSRLGGADKAALPIDGRALVDYALDALAGCSPLIAVGPDSVRRPGVRVVREDPPFGGPVAALAAALLALEDIVAPPEGLWILACDLPRAGGIVRSLRGALQAQPLSAGEDGAILQDRNGRDQWLAGLYRLESLREAFARLAGTARLTGTDFPGTQPQTSFDGVPFRRLVAGLRLRTVADQHGDAVDLDTWDDVHAYTGAARKEHTIDGKDTRMYNEPPPSLKIWIEDLAPALGLDPAAVPAQMLLDVTRDAAHTVTRPAGPITTYLMGLAVAAGADPEEAAVTVRARIEAWRAAHPQEDAQEKGSR
ncbi:NTP transferase domain-containing protein [Psychromicrobium xiongbiense]|uniref:NTP transferase domain-containing protein n=1 Tax=Psychromicrobium xiongbiense TaxID=3051184 RepID=UPI002553684A|nr:NTP transferase domain-containing protein [Psychromicrobium sp. YIM S02556]